MNEEQKKGREDVFRALDRLTDNQLSSDVMKDMLELKDRLLIQLEKDDEEASKVRPYIAHRAAVADHVSRTLTELGRRAAEHGSPEDPNEAFYALIRPVQVLFGIWVGREKVETGEFKESDFDYRLTKYDEELRNHCGDDVAQYVIEQSMDIINLRKFGGT